MKKVFLIIKTAAVVLIIGSTAHSQSVGDVARKERERRMALPAHARIITNADFKNGVSLRPAEPIQSETNLPPKLESNIAAEKTPSSARREVRSQVVTRKDPKAGQDRLSPSVAENSSGAISQPRYIVQPGDTLWQIAEVFLGSGRRSRDILETNRLADPDHLRPGDQLQLPSTTVAHINVPKRRTGFAAYRVKRGESLWSISEIVLGDGALWPRLLKWNPHLSAARHLQVGEFLYILEEVLAQKSFLTKTGD